MAANLDLFRMHLHRQPNSNTKLALQSPIVDCENVEYVVDIHLQTQELIKQQRIMLSLDVHTRIGEHDAREVQFTIWA